MTKHETPQLELAAVSVARQGVFDRQRRLWGYELFCVGNTDATPSGLPSESCVPVRVAASAGVALQRILGRQKRVLVNLTEKNILDDQAYALPPDSTTVFVGEQTFRKPGIADRVRQLKADGFPGPDGWLQSLRIVGSRQFAKPPPVLASPNRYFGFRDRNY